MKGLSKGRYDKTFTGEDGANPDTEKVYAQRQMIS